MRLVRLAGTTAVLVALVMMIAASQAPAASGVGSSSAMTTQIVSGSQAPTAVDMVDGVPASQAPGTFIAGQPVALDTSAVPAAVSMAVVAASAPSGCRDAGVNWTDGSGATGATTWKIWNHTHWCYRDWKVTSVTGWTDVYTMPLWTSSNVSWGWLWWDNPGTARSTSKADFCLGAYFACLQEEKPVVNTWINGAGHYSFDDSNWD